MKGGVVDRPDFSPHFRTVLTIHFVGDLGALVPRVPRPSCDTHGSTSIVLILSLVGWGWMPLGDFGLTVWEMSMLCFCQLLDKTHDVGFHASDVLLISLVVVVVW